MKKTPIFHILSVTMVLGLVLAACQPQVVEVEKEVVVEKVVEKAVEVEVEFAPLYKSQPLFRDVDRFMAELGFSLFKLRRMQWVRNVAGVLPSRSAGQLVFGDALYLDDPRQAEALVLLACLYDCYDFALELIGDPAIAGFVDAVGIKRYIKRRSRRTRLGGLWKRRADRLAFFSWLRGYSSDWARGDLDFYSRV